LIHLISPFRTLTVTVFWKAVRGLSEIRVDGVVGNSVVSCSLEKVPAVPALPHLLFAVAKACCSDHENDPGDCAEREDKQETEPDKKEDDAKQLKTEISVCLGGFAHHRAALLALNL